MLYHRERTESTCHRNPSAKYPAKSVRFDSASYLKGLLAELDRAEISVRLGQSRETAGLTQPELADLLSVHFRSIQDWETPKKQTVPFDRLDEWARLTNVTREWLLYGEETEEDDRLAEVRAQLEEQVARLTVLNDRLEARLAEQVPPRRTRKPA